MERISVLDCTLRDGGYANNWRFGNESIKYIINKLNQGNIDIIECGFLKQTGGMDQTSLYSNLDVINKVIPEDIDENKLFCMINYGEYDEEYLPNCEESRVKGIRVTFHKKDVADALVFCKALKNKGYRVFVQPMCTNSYTDDEILQMIESVNEINPEAIYIVDSFGVMKKNDLLKLFLLMDNNLNPEIKLGYHSHNNMQLSFANAQYMCDIHTRRSIILDCSVLGMGRGAGNLNTELFLDYYNSNFENKYDVYPILNIIDEKINKFYANHYWGYSLPHYLSANNNCHPNYATYLSEKNTLNITSINNILSSIPENRKFEFSREYAEELYKNYEENFINDDIIKKNIIDEIGTRKILILVPGKTLRIHKEDILDFIEKNNPFIINVNFKTDMYKEDFIFFGNEKRYYSYTEHNDLDSKIILSSNIRLIKEDLRVKYKVNYNNIINSNEVISDNSTLMLINFLLLCNYQEIYIAGFDGYNINEEESYINPEMARGINLNMIQLRNKEISNKVKELKEKISLNFLTPSTYLNSEEVEYSYEK